MSVWQMVSRSVLSFTVLWLFTRLMGKHTVSQLTVFDYIIGITAGALAATTSIDADVRPIIGIGSIAVWCSLAIFLGWVSLKSYWFRKIAEGEAAIVIRNGKILDRNMARMHYNINDLLSQLRQQQVFDIDHVEFAVLEPNGYLSVLKKTQYQPVVPHQLQIPTGYQGIPSELVIDGVIIESNLKLHGLSQEWLSEQLVRRGVPDHKAVMLAMLNSDGSLYLDLRDSIKRDGHWEHHIERKH